VENRVTPKAEGWVDNFGSGLAFNYSEEPPIATYYSGSDIKGLG